jgi:hypothetical protein
MAQALGIYYTQLSIGPYKRNNNAFTLSEFAPTYIVHLPLPTELRDDTTVGYSPVNLETVGDFLDTNKRAGLGEAAALRNIGNLAQAGISGTSRGISELTVDRGPLAKLAGGAMSGLMGALQSLVPAEQISSAIQQKMGAAPNPNPSVQFQGPVLRDFTLTWAFYPKNPTESATIDKLIRNLKARALPSNNRDNGGAVLNYPHICQLNFYPWDGKGTRRGEHGHSTESIIKIKKCFMSGVNANYNAFGTPGFFEGTQLPISYQLTINFKEIEYLLSDDWDPEMVERAGANGTIETVGLVANERDAVTEQIQVPNIIGAGAEIAFGVAGTVGKEFLQAGVEVFFDEITDVDDLDAIASVDAALDTLKPPVEGEPATSVTITVPDRSSLLASLQGLFTEFDIGAGIRPAGQVTITQNAEGKFVVVLDPVDTPESNRFPAVVRPPETLGTFDDRAALDAFFEEQGISTKGTVTNPPPPATAAPAP